MMKRFFYVGFLMSCLLFACTPDTDLFIADPLFPEGDVFTTISGYIVDENNEPVEGATVDLNEFTRVTNTNGFFVFKNIQVDALRTMMTASKDGYFESGRAIIPVKGSNTALKIKLLDRSIVANFNGSTGGSVDLPNDVLLEIPLDAVLDANNVGFSGDVQIAAHSLNPEYLSGLERMPTDLKSENQLLESFGIFLFDWTDIDNQKLTIVPGKKVTIHFPIPADFLGNAPSNIGLWFFDGLNWVEDGTATLTNGKYVGEVGKTGFWNCAQPHDFISVKGVLKNESNEVLSHMPFSVKIENGGVMGYGYGDVNGNFIANVPKNLPSQVSILDECNDKDYVASIGALTEDALVSNVKIGNSLEFSHLEGTLINCNNNNVQTGYLILSVDTKTYFFPITNGDFKGDINACDFSEANLVAYDVENQKQSEPLQFEIIANTELGEINVCF